MAEIVLVVVVGLIAVAIVVVGAAFILLVAMVVFPDPWEKYQAEKLKRLLGGE